MSDGSLIDERAAQHAWDTLMLCDRVGKAAFRQALTAYEWAKTPAGIKHLAEMDREEA